MTKHNRFPPEVRQRAVRRVLENQNTYNSKWETICSIVPMIGYTSEKMRIWIRQQEPVNDERDALNTNEHQRLKELECENRELRSSNDILRQASAYFALAEFDRHWRK